MQELKDCGHVVVKCSNCRAGLLDLWLTRPDEEQRWKVKANCPFCGDESFVEEFAGGFHPAGCGLPREDDEDEVVASTQYEGFDVVDEVLVFEVKKARSDAQPILF